jgi:hypothetical protein
MPLHSSDQNRIYDFFLEVAKGQVPGHSLKIVRGHNAALALDTLEDVWEAGGVMTYLSSAETMNIASTSTSDDGDPGAGTVLVEGVDNNGAYISEVVTLNGTTDVLTTNSFLRVNFMKVLTAGSTGWNVGDVTATASSAGTVQDEMDATEGVSQSSHHTIPLGKTGYLYKVEINGARLGQGGSTPEIEFKGYGRPFGGAWIQLFDKNLDTSVTDELDVILPFPSRLVARTDIRMTGTADINASEARTRMYILQVDDEHA